MNLYCYYDTVPLHDQENELRMLNHWRRHHARLGFTPVVLEPWHARKHPYYENIHEAVSRLPSINPKGYDLACYDRWIAMATVAGGHGIMADYDTFLYPAVADDMTPLIALTGAERQKLRVYQNTTPCLVVGTAQTFNRWAWEFARYQPAPDLKHTSDMVILEEFAIKEPDSFDRFRYVKCYGEEGWDRAPAVHYSNASMTPAGKAPRWKFIPELRKLEIES